LVVGNLVVVVVLRSTTHPLSGPTKGAALATGVDTPRRGVDTPRKDVDTPRKWR
jgi:hypothetical protein